MGFARPIEGPAGHSAKSLARFPARWNHLAEKDSRQINMEQILITKVFNFAVSLVLVRYLGVEELGRYAYIIAYTFSFGALADFGLAAYSMPSRSNTSRSCAK